MEHPPYALPLPDDAAVDRLLMQAARNANGTGPYMLKSREVDVRTVFVENPDWWGRSEKASAALLGNVTEAVYTVIQQDATRLAALASGEVDFVIDAPFQDAARLKRDAALKVAETTDLGTQYLGFDQERGELAFDRTLKVNPNPKPDDDPSPRIGGGLIETIEASLKLA